MIASPTFLASSFGVSYSAEILGRSATVYAAAVISGTESGTLATVTAQVIPGSGRTYITVTPSAELDTQESAQIAASVAARLAGKPIPIYDILFTMNAPTEIVGGPSAGAACLPDSCRGEVSTCRRTRC